MSVNPDWYEAIFTRHSCREFNQNGLSDFEFNEMRKFGAIYKQFGSEVRVRIAASGGSAVFKSVMGFGGVKGVDAYMAFVGESKITNESLVKIGYAGEAAILEAVRLGLDTCWNVSLFQPIKVRSQLNIEDTKQVYGVSPLGHALTKSINKSHKRKEMKAIVIGDQQELWQASALEAARLAPSAYNRQPWRFVIGGESILLRLDTLQTMDRGISKYLDCGAVMLHLELGALRAGKPGKWQYILKDSDVARFTIES